MGGIELIGQTLKEFNKITLPHMGFILVQDYLSFSCMVSFNRPNKVLKPTYAAVNSYSPKYRRPDETPFKISTAKRERLRTFRRKTCKRYMSPVPEQICLLVVFRDPCEV